MNQAITSIDIVAYINDEASAELAAKIEADPTLLAQAKEMRALDAEIRAQILVAGRPTAADEAAYLLGDVSAEKAAWLEKFWSQYPSSRSGYAEAVAKDILTQQPEPSLLQQIGEKVQQQVEILLAALQPVQNGMLAVRGGGLIESDHDPIYVVETHDIEVALYIAEDLENPKYLEMLCHLNADEGKLPNTVRLELWHDAQIEPVAQLEGESDEAFTFTGLNAAVYTLIITGEQLEIHVPNIKVQL